jgi:hypothetical protein
MVVLAVALSSSANAAIRIPIDRDVARVLVVVSDAIMLTGAAILIYKKAYTAGFFLLGATLFPLLILAGLLLSGTSFRW